MPNIVFNYGHWEFWAPYDPANGDFGTQKVVFDGLNKLIIVADSTTTLSIKEDVYSAWKEWTLAVGSPYEQAIRTIGGDPTIAGQFAGDIYFLINGWRLVLDVTKVKVTGVLFSDDFDTADYDSNLNAVFPAEVTSIVNTIQTTENVVTGTPEEIAEAVKEALNALTLEQFIALKD